MKLLFINPSLRPGSQHLFLPVGLGYVMTYIKKAGFKFDLLDIDVHNYSDTQVEDYIKKNSYDVICLGSIVTHYKWMKWCINMIKEHQPESKVIVGNSLGGSIPEVLFKTTKVDITIYGEAELTLLEVLNAIKDNSSLGHPLEPLEEISHSHIGYPSTVKGEGIKGIIYRHENLVVNNGKRKAVKNIDEFPFPDWDMFEVEKYLNQGRKHRVNHAWHFKPEDAIVLPINTARGCVFKCTFCHYVFWHDPYRHRSAENVIAEIKQNQKKYGANFFNFWDELSFHKIEPAEKFVDELIKADLKIHWSCAIRADLLGKDLDPKGNPIPREKRVNLAKKFVKAGCVSAGYSLESGSDKILEAMNKKVKSKFFKEQVSVCRDAGLVTGTSIIIGYPQETKETIAETMGQLEELKVYPSTGFLLALPETGMWDYAIKNGYIKDIDKYLIQITERQDFSLNMTKMSDKEMKDEVLKWLKKLNKKFGKLNESELIKTGGKNTEEQNKSRKLPSKEKIDYNETTNDSLNYATSEGTLR
jgi:radical SAM superfamily enzyme YgiQ (UPF0313 family)